MIMYFMPNYPSVAPRCMPLFHLYLFIIGVFTPALPHPNIFPQGQVCLSLLTDGWKPAITIRQLLLGIQALLDEPNPKSPANHDHYTLYRTNEKKYIENVKAFAAKHLPE